MLYWAFCWPRHGVFIGLVDRCLSTLPLFLGGLFPVRVVFIGAMPCVVTGIVISSVLTLVNDANTPRIAPRGVSFAQVADG